MTSQMTTHATTAIETDSQVCKSVVFEVAGYWLALPLGAIARIMARSSASVRQVEDGLMYLGDQVVTWLNLYPLLLKPSPENKVESSVEPFVVIVHGPNRSLCAIPVDKPPTLLELPLSQVQPIPATFDQVVNRIAQHVAVLSQPDVTVFLLNVQQAIAQL